VSSALVVRRMGGDGFTRLSLDEPCPVIMADGIGGVCRRGWQYWVEDAATLMPAGHVPSDGDPVEPIDLKAIEEAARQRGPDGKTT